jgi:hypothetical protein
MCCRNGSLVKSRKGTRSSFDMNRRNVHRWLGAWTLLAWAALMLLSSGCATSTESENLSSRPWNTPKNWEGGMPSGMFEGR